MLPSLVAEDLRGSLTSFLGTTFALGDDDVRAELERFVGDPREGVFRGPFVRLRLPFRPADEGWRAALDWAPRGFGPHRHQADAWLRLASRDRIPQPTLVTTGTGSGKTESFLIPLLDHCRRHRGQRGVKALVLYPMNALANDQARRIAQLVHRHADELGGLRVGLYTGDSAGGAEMTDSSVIGDRYELRRSPPDILLTNYKMLDMMLLRSEDNPLFAGAGESLRYLVLDEFHTYDGAQGTDVAMLLRRLGTALGVTTAERPLGAITPVATSATLGSGAEGGPKLCEFAETVFGTPFDPGSLVVEDRLSVEEWTASPRPSAGWAGSPPPRIPLLDEVTAALADASTHADQVLVGMRLFLGTAYLREDDLGERLRAHPITTALVRLAGTPCSLDDLAREVEPSWAAGSEGRRDAARRAVALYLALLSKARSADGKPLLTLDVQLWVREVSRLVRQVSRAPRFRWHDGAAVADEAMMLPSVYCRHCGRSGWGVVATAGGAHDTKATSVWTKSVGDPSVTRAWIFALGEAAQSSPEVRWIDPEVADFAPAPTSRHSALVPVLVTPDAEAAKKQRCPSCGQDDGIRFLGSRVATLASATLGQLFGSADVEASEKKTLVFTDSVQDASHRAAFVESRAYALNLRALLHRAIGEDGCTLDAIGPAVAAAADGLAERYALLPPDLREHQVFRHFWTAQQPGARVRRAVAKRMGFAAVLEFGLSSRVGRTLELTGAVSAYVEVDDLPGVVEAALAAATRQDVQLRLDGVAAQRTTAWARGVLERIRTQGGIAHDWLTKYARTGNRHSIWGGRPRIEGMPAFPARRPAPSFPTSARHSDAFDSIIGPRTWYATWTARVLGVAGVDAPRYVRALLDALTVRGVLGAVAADGGATVWQLPPTRVRLARTAGTPRMLRCTVCSARLPGPDLVLDQLDGAPCQRDRCGGVYAVETTGRDYYRDLYRGGRVRRIVARRAHVAAARSRTRGAGERVQGRAAPGHPERADLHSHAGAGHRHRRPVDGRAHLAAPLHRVLPAAGGAGGAAHRQRARGLAAPGPAAGAAAPHRPAHHDRRRGRAACVLPGRHGDPAPPVPRVAVRPARPHVPAGPHAPGETGVRGRPGRDVVAGPDRGRRAGERHRLRRGVPARLRRRGEQGHRGRAADLGGRRVCGGAACGIRAGRRGGRRRVAGRGRGAGRAVHRAGGGDRGDAGAAVVGRGRRARPEAAVRRAGRRTRRPRRTRPRLLDLRARSRGPAAQLRAARRHHPPGRGPVVDRRGDRRPREQRRAIRARQPHRALRVGSRRDVLRPRHLGGDRRCRPGHQPQPGHHCPPLLPGLRMVGPGHAGCRRRGLSPVRCRRGRRRRSGTDDPAIPAGLGLRLARAGHARRRHRRAAQDPVRRAHHGRQLPERHHRSLGARGLPVRRGGAARGRHPLAQPRPG